MKRVFGKGLFALVNTILRCHILSQLFWVEVIMLIFLALFYSEFPVIILHMHALFSNEAQNDCKNIPVTLEMILHYNAWLFC